MIVLRRAFVVASIGWALALPLAAWAASRAHASAAWYVFAAGVYAAGSFVCHQLPERSFHLWAIQLPVCARCTGIYVGAGASAVVSGLSRTSVRLKPRVLLLVAALPTVATLVYEWTTGQAPGNWARAIAGVPLGVAVGWVVVNARGSGGPDEKGKVN